jgi:hypothetical protein
MTVGQLNKESSKTKLPVACKVVIARNLREIEAIRPIWEMIQNSEPHRTINADIDRYISVIRAGNGEKQPYVMLFEHNSRPEMMIIAWIEKYRLELRLGYKTLLKPMLRCLSVVYGGVIGEGAENYCALVMDELMKVLRNREADMIYLNHLRANSRLYQCARTMPCVPSRGFFPKVEPHYSMSIPNDIGSFYENRSPKHRKHLKQYIRGLEKAFPGQVKVVVYNTENELDELIKVVSGISFRSYQFGIGCGISNDFRTRTLLTTAAKFGWLRAYILFINDEPCAFRVVLHYGRTYFADGIGYDPKWKKHRVGTVLFLKVLENLCGDPTVERYDFGFGDAEYKESYSDNKWLEASACIFAPRFYPVLINILQAFMEVLSIGIVFIMRRLGCSDWVKRSWRSMLKSRRLQSAP